MVTEGLNLLQFDFHQRMVGIFEAFWLLSLPSLLCFFHIYIYNADKKTGKKGAESMREEGREGTQGQLTAGCEMQSRFFKTACSKHHLGVIQ